jgi:hypothetical protein
MKDDDFDKLSREVKFDAASKAIKKDPDNWSNSLEELGFAWVDDGHGDEEEAEEEAAKAENNRQVLLTDYFNGFMELSEDILDAFIAERDSDEPNYPLIRKYFKKGNDLLKELLLAGLKRQPTDITVLGDLCFFHHHKNILSTLLPVFKLACLEEQDSNRFGDIAKLFYFETEPDGYDALHELLIMFDQSSDKGKILQEISKEVNSKQNDDIEF